MEYVRKTFTFEGKRYTVRGKTEKEAYIKMADKQRELEAGSVVISNSMTVEEWGLKCVEIYKTRQKDITRRKYLSRMKRCVFEYIGDRRLKDVKRIELVEVLNQQQGKSAYQIKTVKQMLQFIFSKAKENNLIANNPAENLEMPAGTTKKRRQITSTEREHFLAVCENDDRMILFLLMYYCGCRPVEAMNAVGADIQEVDGWNMLHIRGEKSANADRFVPIPDTLYKRIKDTPKDKPIATSPNGNKFSPEAYKWATKALRRAMNISMGCEVYRNELIPPYPLAQDFVPYDLRHTYCCDLKKAGVDIRNAQYLMGHSDITLTANIYTHTDHDDIVAVAKQMNQYRQSVTLPVTQAPESVEK